MNIVKICITGPESTGKSTLAKELSEFFKMPLVNEYAREYLESLNRKYNSNDLIGIAKRQLENQDSIIDKSCIDEEKLKSSMIIFLDTDLITIDIWMRDKFSRNNTWLQETAMKNSSNHYLLCYPDIGWDPDPQREDPNRQLELFRAYEKYLLDINASFQIVKGQGKKRIDCAVRHVNDWEVF